MAVYLLKQSEKSRSILSKLDLDFLLFLKQKKKKKAVLYYN